jgi:hypothetical protein
MKLFEAFGELALKGQEQVMQGLKDVDQQGQSFGQRMDQFGQKVGRAGSAMTRWVSGPMAAAGVGLAALTKKVAANADRIAKGSREVGLSYAAYQELTFVLGQVAGASDELSQRALGRLNQRIGIAAREGGKYAEALVEMGYTQEQVASGAITAEDAFNKLTTRLSQSSTASEAAAVASEILGVRIGRVLGPALQQNAGVVQDLRNKYRDLGLGISGEALEASEKFNDQLDVVTRQFKVVGVEIATAFMPVLMDLMLFIKESVAPVLVEFAESLGAIFDWFQKLPEPMQSFLGTIAAIVVALGPFLVIAGKVLSMFSKIKVAIVAIIALKAGITSFLAVTTTGFATLTAAAAPWIALAALIVAAVVGIIAIFENWGAITEWLGQVWDSAVSSIESGATSVLDFMTSWGSKFVDIFRRLPDTILSFISSLASGAWNAIKQMGSNIINGLANAWSNALNGAQQFVRSMIGAISRLPGVIIRTIRDMAMSVVTAIRNMVLDTLSWLRELYNQAVGNSIIPDMARDIGAEMDQMADAGGESAKQFANNVSGDLENAQSGWQSGMAAQTVSGSGDVHVDMRNSIIRDDRDLTDRLMRKGGELAGAF